MARYPRRDLIEMQRPCFCGRRSGALALVAALMTLALFPSSARALCSVDPCIGASPDLDCDQDGFTNQEECGGISTAAGTFPSCGATGAVRPNCVDPRSPDLFVLFQKASPSVYDELGIAPDAALGPIAQGPSAGGLALQLHIIDAASVTLPSTPQRNSITPRQAAVFVQEVRTPPATACPVTGAIGRVNTPTSVNNSAVAQIFSQRILDSIDCIYDSVDPSIPESTRLPNKRALLLHTTSHETTHLTRLAPESVERFGGHHYKTGTGCVLDQATTYSTKGGRVTINVSTAYCGPDRSAIDAGRTGFGATLCEDRDDIADADGFSFPETDGFGCKPVGP